MPSEITILIVEPDDKKFENAKTMATSNKYMKEYIIKRAKTVNEALSILFDDSLKEAHKNIDIVMAPQNIPKENINEYYNHNFGVLTIMRKILDSGSNTLTVVLDYVESIKLPTSACKNVMDSVIYTVYRNKNTIGDIWNG